ncbi:MAG: hypothetical protein R8M11_08955 [Gallionella sp.]
MSQSEAKEGAAGSKRGLWIKLAVVTLIVLFVGIAVMSLPKGYSDDLSMLGKGKVAVVLIRDKNAVESFDMLNVMDGLRGQFSGKVDFLLTDFNTSQGKAFMAASGSDRTNLVLVDGKGQPVKVLRSPQSPSSVQQELSALFGIKP